MIAISDFVARMRANHISGLLPTFFAHLVTTDRVEDVGDGLAIPTDWLGTLFLFGRRMSASRKGILDLFVAQRVRVHLTALSFAIVHLAVVLLSAHVAADDVILTLVTFLDDHVATFLQDDLDFLATLSTHDGFVTLLGAVVAANRKRELDRRLTVVVRVRRTTVLGARMFLTIHF